MELITRSRKETYLLGQKIGRRIINQEQKRIIYLCGELGSGKTTFVQGLAKSFSINSFIPSPTFIIVRQYPLFIKGFRSFFHIDLYRIGKKKEIKNIGLDEILTDPANLIAIEWAEKLENFTPKQRIEVRFTVISEQKRKIEIKPISKL